jgi:hypothetical protein
MKHIEFISYEETPEDGMQKGIVTLRYHGQIQKWQLVTKKDGTGVFFGSSSCYKTVSGQKIWEKSLTWPEESAAERKEFDQYLRDAINSQARKPKISHGNATPHVEDNGLPF